MAKRLAGAMGRRKPAVAVWWRSPGVAWMVVPIAAALSAWIFVLLAPGPSSVAQGDGYAALWDWAATHGAAVGTVRAAPAAHGTGLFALRRIKRGDPMSVFLPLSRKGHMSPGRPPYGLQRRGCDLLGRYDVPETMWFSRSNLDAKSVIGAEAWQRVSAALVDEEKHSDGVHHRWSMAITLGLLLETSHADTSYWAPYLQTLPVHDPADPLPPLWTESMAAELQHPTSVSALLDWIGAMKADYAAVRRTALDGASIALSRVILQWRPRPPHVPRRALIFFLFRRPTILHRPQLKEHSPPDPALPSTLGVFWSMPADPERWLWCRAMLMSRALDCRLPLWTDEHGVVRSVRSQAHSSDPPDAPVTQDICLIPIIDVANAWPTPAVNKTAGGGASSADGIVPPKNDNTMTLKLPRGTRPDGGTGLAMYSTRAAVSVRAGDEVLQYYHEAPRSTVYHMRHYGFVFGDFEVTAGDFITMTTGKTGSADWAVASDGLIPRGLIEELGTSLSAVLPAIAAAASASAASMLTTEAEDHEMLKAAGLPRWRRAAITYRLRAKRILRAVQTQIAAATAAADLDTAIARGQGRWPGCVSGLSEMKAFALLSVVVLPPSAEALD